MSVVQTVVQELAPARLSSLNQRSGVLLLGCCVSFRPNNDGPDTEAQLAARRLVAQWRQRPAILRPPTRPSARSSRGHRAQAPHRKRSGGDAAPTSAAAERKRTRQSLPPHPASHADGAYPHLRERPDSACRGNCCRRRAPPRRVPVPHGPATLDAGRRLRAARRPRNEIYEPPSCSVLRPRVCLFPRI
jgi:hypothetical protein